MYTKTMGNKSIVSLIIAAAFFMICSAHPASAAQEKITLTPIAPQSEDVSLKIKELQIDLIRLLTRHLEALQKQLGVPAEKLTYQMCSWAGCVNLSEPPAPFAAPCAASPKYLPQFSTCSPVSGCQKSEVKIEWQGCPK